MLCNVINLPVQKCKASQKTRMDPTCICWATRCSSR